MPRCLTVASSDSGGGAGIQADLKAFAAADCYGSTVIVGLTAQNTRTVYETFELPPSFIEAQLEAVITDIGCDAAKTGALLSGPIVEVVAAFFAAHPTPLVVDPVMMSSSGTRLLSDDGVRLMISRLLPVATVVTPNEHEAELLAGARGTRAELSERLVARGARAVLITGGASDPMSDHLFDGVSHVEIAQTRVDQRSTHGSGCTHSATLAAELAKGASLLQAATTAARVTSSAIAAGLTAIGGGEGPVDVLRAVRM